MQRPRWGSRVGTPKSGVAGAASRAPLREKGNDKCKRDGNGGAEKRAGFKGKPVVTTTTAKGKNAGWQPALRGHDCRACYGAGKTNSRSSTLYRVGKFSSFVFVGLGRNLIGSVFRVERIAKSGKIDGRAGVRAWGRQRRASRARQAKRPYAEKATAAAKATANANVKNAGWQPALRGAG